jgi:hypothetical protein
VHGKLVEMRGETYVWCGHWDDGADVRTLRIQQGSPFAPPWWSLELRVALARGGTTIAMPALVSHRAAIFVSDPRREIEASSDSERSRGRIAILDDASCHAGSHIRVTIDTTLAGEASGTPSVVVHGTFAGVVGTKPAPGVGP